MSNNINFLNAVDSDFVEYIINNIKGVDNMLNYQDKIVMNLRSEFKKRGIDMIQVEDDIKLDVIEKIENILGSDNTISNVNAKDITLYVEYLEKDTKAKLDEILKGLKIECDTYVDDMEYKRYEILEMLIDYFYNPIDKSADIIFYNK